MRVEHRGADVILAPGAAVNARLRPPGSKSLTNRFLTCLALADGHSTITGAAICDDTERMAAGLSALGLRVETDAARETISLEGGGGFLPAVDAEIDVGNAGTTMRFLAALACLGRGRYRLDGSPRMRERPIRQLVDALTDIGGAIGYDAVPGYPPLTMEARGLQGGQLEFREPPSSQYISAILMVAPYACQDVYIAIEGGLPSHPYVNMTIDVMRALGVEVLEGAGPRYVVASSQRYRAGDFEVEPDASGATYLWAAAAITGGCVRVDGLTRASHQGDARFVDVLERMGCEVREGPDFLEVQGPPVGRLCGVDEDLNAMPDTVQTLAVTALFANGPTNVRNVANLRIKETDRIDATARELAKLGAVVETRDDGLTVKPPAEITPAEIATYDDHRMAMSFALAGLRASGIVIRDADCVSKSFPNYFDVMSQIGTPA